MPYRLVNADRIGPVSHYNWKRPVTDTNMPSTGRVFCIQIRHSGNISLDGMVTVNADGSVQCQEVNYRQIASKLKTQNNQKKIRNRSLKYDVNSHEKVSYPM